MLYRNQWYQVDKGTYKLIVLKNIDPDPTEKEAQPAYIVFIGERSDNKGMSVTNYIEEIAGQVWKDFLPRNTDLAMVCWVECYPDNDPPSMDTVTFDVSYERNGVTFSNPHWTPTHYFDWERGAKR